MRYLELRSEGFRNLSPFSLSFHPAVNWIHGANGQGKTNLLESLIYLVSGRSHRLARDEEIVAFGGEHFFLAGELEDDGGEKLRFSASYARGGRKRIRLNEDEVERLSDLVGLTGAVVFGPGDVELVTGEPEKRRRYLNYTLSKTDPGYLRDLIAYRRALRQRNALLREERTSGRHLDAWTGRLVEIGSRIILQRRENIVLLAEHAARFYGEIGADGEALELSYRSPIEGGSEAEVAGALQARLENLRGSELLKRRTLAGPHRDDMVIDISGRDARKFASQGQKRSAAVALKLAQAEFLARTRRDRPIVFLDDVFSELDRERREKLCRLVGGNYQTFLASPHPEDLRPDLFGDMWRFEIDGGRVRAEQEI